MRTELREHGIAIQEENNYSESDLCNWTEWRTELSKGRVEQEHGSWSPCLPRVRGSWVEEAFNSSPESLSTLKYLIDGMHSRSTCSLHGAMSSALVD